MKDLTRRHFLGHSLAGGVALATAGLVATAGAGEPSLIIGGGPAGAATALAIRAARPEARVTLVERDPTRLAGNVDAPAALMRPSAVGYGALAQAGVGIVIDEVVGLDWRNRRLELFSGRRLPFGTLVVAPGTAPRAEAIPGFDAVAGHQWPAVWGSAREARRFAGQLAALPERGHVVLRLPADAGGNPDEAARRALYIAQDLERNRPDARLTVLDAAEQSETAATFAALLPETTLTAKRVTWCGPVEGGTVLAVDTRRGRLETPLGAVTADVVNFVTPRRAAAIAHLAGLADESGWCPCAPDGRSGLRPAAFVVGDARKGARRSVSGALEQGRATARASLMV
ncbi:FAD-dependent oxidoreductase [Tropicimonas isoalkanivorans]|uniref:Pyridine nucleotide-disulphide oxidoreductase n=1 Tax=Tropicimonas isoalkanivorans TaxID=441112 RepID=A0A1I1HCX5_9RHOB|nr:FAD-dependent oxidoreductase [Tropicimonas isoalkanivorans]SFC19828.1 Pyridine nucleotide-disulphide oxidoreductase [Tropicimonas isoalkanivorans]